MATSACCSSVEKSLPWSGVTAMPTLASTSRLTPSSTNGAASSARMPPAQRLRVHGVGQVGQQDDEFVAAEAGDAVALPQHPREPRADLLQQQVTVMVAESVVDLLEPVEVEQQERHPPAGAIGAPDGRQSSARSSNSRFGKSGQRIVIGQVVVVVGLLAQAPGRAPDQPEEHQPEERQPAESDGPHHDNLVLDVASPRDARERKPELRPASR